MANSHVTAVDAALDKYVATMQKRRGIDPSGFKVETIARIARIASNTMSFWLQEYRYAQGNGRPTKYVIACQGYGRAARWRILAKPSSDLKTLQDARRIQAIWAIQDINARYRNDMVNEVLPALRGTGYDQSIAQVIPLVEHQLDGIKKHVERVLAPRP